MTNQTKTQLEQAYYHLADTLGVDNPMTLAVKSAINEIDPDYLLLDLTEDDDLVITEIDE
ncbi:hypothetical protein [Cyanobacterium sp. Dongsha4]|uniref:hypothetical protein n=1 Tax=Cyanobacterium sp. DS4 TaxID=2878255 RepID=UPI002E80950F|nr:hypothetical protein [Cyanobacterium sp. Dongsha4]WVL02555.1 hypothetical protein Dongsha4_18880 [Cyanobacterium sp. Dongsha4]